MDSKKEILFEISRLISKSLAGKITRDEQAKLDSWKRASGHNKMLFDRIYSDVVAREKIRQYREADVQTAFDFFVRRRKVLGDRRRRVRRMVQYAAMLLLPLGVALFYFNREEGEVMSKENQRVEVAVTGRRVPTLTLSNGQEMVLYGEGILLDEVQGIQVRENEAGGLEYCVPDSVKGETVYNTLETPVLCDYSFTLADGTKVWLNAGSKLRYPVAFGGDERVVYASGEMYFEVARDESHPFFVEMDGVRVKVLGTSFNVNAYKGDRLVEVTLVSGKVEAYAGERCYELKPDDQLRYDRERSYVEMAVVDAGDSIAWKDGQYVFRGKKLADVARILERWYAVEIVLEGSVGESIFTGVVNKEESFDAFVQRLGETSSLLCRMEGNKLYVR